MADVTTIAHQVESGMAVEQHSFTWRIQNFSVIRKSKTLIEAQNFQFHAGESLNRPSMWKVFLMESIQEAERRWVGIGHNFVAAPSSSSRNTSTWDQCYVQYRFVIEKEDGTSFWNSDMMTKDIPSYAPGWGWKKLIEADDGATLSVDNLIIRFEFKLYAPSKLRFESQLVKTTVTVEMEDLQAKLATDARRDLARLLQNTIPCSDIKLISNDEVEFTAQKGILAVRSPVFEAMFRTDMNEGKDGIIKLPDISSKPLQILLHYLYTGELLPDWTQADVLVELTNSAGKYQLTGLLTYLDLTLGKVCCLENVGALMIQSNQLSLKTAQMELLNFIREKSLNSPAAFYEMLKDIGIGSA